MDGTRMASGTWEKRERSHVTAITPCSLFPTGPASPFAIRNANMDRTHSLSALLPQAPNFELQVKSLILASEADIARLESQIRDLQCLRATEYDVLARLRAAIAPIRKIPTELLAEIFLQVHHSEMQARTRMYGRMSLIRHPVHTLSQVCAHWRRVAHTTPRLWTEHMEAFLEKTPTAKYIARMEEWLERSAPLPVPITLRCWGTGAEVGPLMDVFFTAAHRWSSAEFSLDSLSALSHIPVDSLRSLEKLSLISTDVHNFAKVQAFLAARLLRDVRLVTGCTAELLIPWSQLTTIDVTDPLPWDCLNTLVQCTSIVTARFETHAWPVPLDLSERPITTLGQLEDLSVQFSDFPFIAPFFERLALPSLQKLRLELHQNIMWPSQEFTRFQLGSPDIEKLTIHNSDMTATDLITVLQHASSLVELCVRECPLSFDGSLVMGLQYVETASVHLAPRLQILSFSDVVKNFEDDAFDAMIRSRWWTDDQILVAPKVSRWSSICIVCRADDPDVDAELEAKLETYRSQGLDVNLYTGFDCTNY
ncbi:hypothetical protein DFH06DRAFT_1063136 [Mycena polygramma]|nr:hypothetical protein DFH06DRAFT_1063136 [Mycena polygramma]